MAKTNQYVNTGVSGLNPEHEARKDAKIAKVYGNPAKYKITDWPRRLPGYAGRSHPYNFQWRSTYLRRKAVKLMVTPLGGRFRYAHADLLELMLYKFQAAQHLTKPPMAFMKSHRWRWFSQDDLCAELMMKTDQVRDIMKELKNRRLIVSEYKRNVMSVTYYRPSDELWRLCLLLTQLTDDCWLGLQGRGADKESKEICREAMDNLFLEDWQALHEIIDTYLTSNDKDRDAAMQDDLVGLLEKHLDACGWFEEDSAETDMQDELLEEEQREFEEQREQEQQKAARKRTRSKSRSANPKRDKFADIPF